MSLPYDLNMMLKVLIDHDISINCDDDLYSMYKDGHRGYSQMSYDEVRQKYEDHLSNLPPPEHKDPQIRQLRVLASSLCPINQSDKIKEVYKYIRERESELITARAMIEATMKQAKIDRSTP